MEQNKRVGFVSELDETELGFKGFITEYSEDEGGSKKQIHRFMSRNMIAGQKKPQLYSFVQFDVVTDPLAGKTHANNISLITTNRLGYIYSVEPMKDSDSFFGFLFDCTPLDENAATSSNPLIARNSHWDYEEGIYFNNYTYAPDHIPSRGTFVLYDMGFNPHTRKTVAMCTREIEIDRTGYIKFFGVNGGVVVDCETGDKYPYHAAPFIVQKTREALPCHMMYVSFGIATNPLNRPFAIIKTIHDDVDESGLNFKLSTAVEEIRQKRENRHANQNGGFLTGTVTSLTNFYGIIQEGDNSYKFTQKNNAALFKKIRVNDTVEFIKKFIILPDGRSFYVPKIKNIIKNIQKPNNSFIVAEKKEEKTPEIIKQQRQSLIRNTLDSWFVEANREKDDLFYVIDEYKSIAEGKYPFVIGRKGTGKSAICNYLIRQIESASDMFQSRIKIEKVFHTHPFYKEVEAEKQGALQDADYKLIWEYIIYEKFLQLFACDESIDQEIRDAITIVLPQSVIRRKKTISLNKLKFSIFKIGVDAEFGVNEEASAELSSIEKVEVLCNCLQELCAHSRNKFYLLFDELQKAGSELEPVFGMQITKTLLMAIEQFHLDFYDYANNLIPIAFVREDTYRLIMYNDKDKWSDLVVNLSWTKYNIQKMLAYRISKTVSSDGQSLSFDEAWRLYFPSMFLKKANKPIFEDIYEHSFGRPRDFVKFIRESCKRANDCGSIDLEQNWDAQILDFDNSSAESAIQEMNDLIPDFTKIQEAINQIGHTSFTFEELLKEYNPKHDSTVEDKLKNELKILYNFMIIGMIINNGRKYVDSGAIFSVSKPLTIHKCFWPRLGLTHHIVSQKTFGSKQSKKCGLNR